MCNSRRHINVCFAANQVHTGNIEVGVFTEHIKVDFLTDQIPTNVQDEEIELVAYTARSLGLSAVQLHGDETPKYVKALLAVLPKNCEVWKAHGVSDSLPAFEKYNVSKHIVDTRVGEQSGGTGQAFDCSLLSNDDSKTNKIDKSKLILAGGLNPDNAQQAALIGCAGLDFNSGVESEPGKKDADKLNRSFAAIRRYMQR